MNLHPDADCSHRRRKKCPDLFKGSQQLLFRARLLELMVVRVLERTVSTFYATGHPKAAGGTQMRCNLGEGSSALDALRPFVAKAA
jgi:hypothetical protein